MRTCYKRKGIRLNSLGEIGFASKPHWSRSDTGKTPRACLRRPQNWAFLEFKEEDWDLFCLKVLN